MGFEECDVLADWVHEASNLPVAFAQVREDPALDLAAVKDVGADARVIMVASGGCTAALLAASSLVSRLHLVDPNPAQIALTRLKFHLLENSDTRERLALLGHSRMRNDERSRLLNDAMIEIHLSSELLGPPELISQLGPDHCGRYEFVFSKLRKELGSVAPQLRSLLEMDEPSRQYHEVTPRTALGKAIDHAFEHVFALPNLEQIFGSDATQNPVETFSRHFRRRTRHVLATLPAKHNPYLNQLFLGEFQHGTVYPWLTAKAPLEMPRITWSISTIQEALASSAPESFDVVHLSNVLDWLPEREAAETLDLAWGALRRSGLMILRQLNSSLDLPALGRRFHWERELAAELHRKDRSFFYRHLHLGRKT